jgi:5-methylcytosine-specific restriction endonuclease McrA
MKLLGHLEKLARIAGICADDLIDFMMWSLQENIVFRMRKHSHRIAEIRRLPDALHQFRVLAKQETGIEWDIGNVTKYYDEVLQDQDTHYRKQIGNDELLRLIINAEMKCVHCGKCPPEVVMHIDHILPASRGGTSKFENLQFLCSTCNLRKSNKKEKGPLWIDLKCLP